jgi:maltooligosyltrehalose trehalohydrolase
VCQFAPARAYGGPEGLRRLVDSAHARGLAVILDVVYNHLGPDGNYLREFSRAYFTDRHKTPWGAALNFDGPNSGPVRAFFVANACYLAHEYNVDGLLIESTHALLEESPIHILAELGAAVHDSLPAERHFLLIAENENNDPALIRPLTLESDHERRFSAGGWRPSKGLGLDAVWADDFHHQMRVALAGDRDGYYADYTGSVDDLAATLRQGWFYTGQRSLFLNRPRGAPADDVAPPHFVHCIQNHDQVGNRALGERLNHQIDLDAYRAASALLLLSPYTPLLFMGQEWAASSPFLYFTDHHAELGRLVTEGRRAEFQHFTAFSGERVPDPQARDTFLSSKLRWDERAEQSHAGVLRLYHHLLELRRLLPALRERGRDSFDVTAIGDAALALRRRGPAPEDTLLVIVNLRGELRLDLAVRAETRSPARQRWSLLLDSEDERYGGRGPSRQIVDGRVLEIDAAATLLLRASSS